MGTQLRRGSKKSGSNGSQLSTDPGTSPKSYQGKRKLTSAMAVILGAEFGSAVLQYWISETITTVRNSERSYEHRLCRLRGATTERSLNDYGCGLL